MYEPIKVTILAVFSLLCSLQPPQSGKDQKGGGDKKAPAEQVIQPPVRNIVRVIGQPSFIESYERTAMFPKLTAYIQKWNVDIGDRVKHGDTLATLFAPELVEDLQTKRATVQLSSERVELARNTLKVAASGVKAAEARLKEARSILNKFQAEVDRWDAEVTRLKREVERAVVDRDVLSESTNQLKASAAARDAAKSTIEAAEAELLGKQAEVARAEVGIRVAQADLAVASSEVKRLEAWISYLRLTAPFDGVIVARNANTFDLVQPASGGAQPIYVVARADIARVFVEIPEHDAKYVHVGTKATVKVPAYRDEPIAATITRTSWALNVQGRTLRAELDLPNPNGQILPGTYAYVTVSIEHPGVHALPLGAIFHGDDGEKTLCWTYENGRAFRTEIETGLSDGRWVEVTNRRKPGSQPAAKGQASWKPIKGSERIIVGDLSLLADGAPVQVVPASEAELENPPGREGAVKASSGSGKADDRHHDAFGGAQLDQAAEAGSHDAILALAQARIEQAAEAVNVAQAALDVAESRLKETRSVLVKHEAEVERWTAEVTRLKREVDRGVVDRQVLLESSSQLKASGAAVNWARAAIESATNNARLEKAKLGKARADVKVAKAILAAINSKRSGAEHHETPARDARE